MNIRDDHEDNTPIPDPTSLTTQQLLREIYSLRELLKSHIAGMDEKFTTRFEANDKAIELIQVAADRIPSDVDLKTGALKELVNEKFSAIQQQFKERDVCDREVASLNKQAIDAALNAQREVTRKSEENFTKQIDKLDDLINTKTGALGTEIQANLNALDQKSNSNKERLDRIEGQVNGSTTQKNESHSSNVFFVSIIGIVIAFSGLAVTLAVLLHK